MEKKIALNYNSTILLNKKIIKMKTSLITQFSKILLGSIFLCSSYLLSAQSWSLVSGISARDIAVGKNGIAWAIGTNSAIYWWNGSSWITEQGGASRITVDPDGSAWVVNAGGQIFKYNFNNKNWDLKSGTATDIAVGVNGTVWIIGTNSVGGGYGIYKWDGSSWTNIPGGAVRIAVDPSGNAWIVNNSGNIYRYNGSSFEIKSGLAVDVGIGANGTVWCTGTDGRIYQWDGSNWKVKTGGASQVAVAPDGNAWIVNSGGEVYRSTDAATIVTSAIRTLFPRGQTYEFRMLQALKIYPYSNTISLGGTASSYASIDALGQAFGNLGLLAAEIYATQFPNATAKTIITDINNSANTRQKVTGILAVLVMDKISKSAADQPTIALKIWATDLYYTIKVRSAKAVLEEYKKWKADPCSYTADGYTHPPDCGLGGLNFTQWYGTHSPPQDIIGKAGLKSVLGNNADAIASGVSLGIATVALTSSAIALSTSLSVTVAATGSAGYSGTMITLSATNLFTAFGGVTTNASVASSGALGVGWAGVVAAPIAATVLAIVVGTMEGFRVVEAAKVEPMLKMKLGAAMSEPIKISNMMADTNATKMFFIAFQEAANKGFQITKPNVDGEVRFYCQAGYVSSFRLSYTQNGQTVTKTTADLAVGHEETFPIPYDATNIRVQGWYALSGWKELFDQPLSGPTYTCYTSYGTVFEPKYKTDCPEVGNMTTQKNELTVTQGGGYSAWIKLTYIQNGQTVTVLDQTSTAAGWRKVFSLPVATTNIHLQIWNATGLAWEPWKTVIDKTWPYAPNECIKVYGTTLDPKWNAECN